MLSLPSFFTAFILILLLYFWYLKMRAKEIAYHRALSECNKHHYQLLDNTVALHASKFIKQPRLHIHRQYQFDYATNTHARLQGQLHMSGLIVIAITFADVNIVISETDTAKRKDNVIPFPTSLKE
jgi:hypothetical protein